MRKIKAKFYSIPCYFALEEHSLEGRNYFYDLLLSIAIKFHVFVDFVLFLFGKECVRNFPVVLCEMPTGEEMDIMDSDSCLHIVDTLRR